MGMNATITIAIDAERDPPADNLLEQQNVIH